MSAYAALADIISTCPLIAAKAKFLIVPGVVLFLCVCISSHGRQCGGDVFCLL